MQIKTVLIALAGLAAVSEARVARRSPFSSRSLSRRQFGGGFGGYGNNFNNDDNNGDDNNGDDNNDGGETTTLDSSNVQTGSQQDGQNPGGDGQAASATDAANFINFCSGSTLTNGLQNTDGSCNGIPMGKIPSVNNMVSSVIVNPLNGDQVPANEDLNLQVQMINFAPGTFTNATTTYYSAPQDVDGNGNIIGHTHFTVQDTGDTLNPTTPLDPTQFAFFKGIDDAGNGQGLLNTTVTGGLPAGNYRLCTMSSSANHQPVLMPVAQRGAQDDCVRFTVVDNGGSSSDSSSDGSTDTSDDGSTDSSDDGSDSNTDTGSTNTTGNFSGGFSNSSQSSSGADSGSQTNSGDTTTTTTNGSGGSGGANSDDALGGIAAPAVVDTGDSDRPFGVDGNTFTTESAAIERACDIQNNACADAVNSGSLSGASVGDCNNQISQCVSDLSS